MIDLAASVSEHLTWGEATRTDSRDLEILGLQADPPPQVRVNLARTALDLFEPARALVGPLRVTSGYRCPALNERIGGSKNSAHMDGRAFDVQPTRLTIRDAFRRLAASGIPFDQLILELGTWIHMGAALHAHQPRGERLMVWTPGHYEPWNPNDPRVRGVASFT